MTTRPMKPATPRGREILRWIEAYCVSHGYSPTFRELCNGFGWASPNAAAEHLRRLERRQLVTMQDGCSRTVRVTEAGLALLQDAPSMPSPEVAAGPFPGDPATTGTAG